MEELRRAREALGMKQWQVAARVQALCPGHLRGKDLQKCQFDHNQLSKLECGRRRPDMEHVIALCQVFGKSARALGLLSVQGQSALVGQVMLSEGNLPLESEKVVAAQRRTLLRTVGVIAAAGTLPPEAAQSLELARQAQSGGAWHEALSGLRSEITFCTDAYEYLHGDQLGPEVTDCRDRIRSLLQQRLSLREQTELYAHLAKLSLILADIANDKADYTAARVHTAAVRTYSEEAENNDLVAYSWILQSCIALNQGRYREAIRTAQTAYKTASSDSIRAKAAARGEARAYGYLGDKTGLRDAARRAWTAASHVPSDQALGGAYHLDTADVPYYVGDANLRAGSLGDPDQQLLKSGFALSEQARSILAERNEWEGMQAMARLAAATAHARIGDPTQACEIGETTLSERPASRSLTASISRLLEALRPHENVHTVREFEELARSWRRGQLPPPSV